MKVLNTFRYLHTGQHLKTKETGKRNRKILQL